MNRNLSSPVIGLGRVLTLLVLATGMSALGGCSQPAQPTAAEDEKFDRAMDKVGADQARADQAEIRKQAVMVNSRQQSSIDLGPVAPLPTPAGVGGPKAPATAAPIQR